MTTTTATTQVNGIDVDALTQAIEAIVADPAKGQTRWQVTLRWRGGTRSDTSVKAFQIGGQRVAKDFTIRVDEPYELCGTNQFANPQEYLLAALNACMIVGYAAVCASEDIELDDLRIETEGDYRPSGLSRHRFLGEAWLRRLALHRAYQRQCHRRAIRTSPQNRKGDFAQPVQCGHRDRAREPARGRKPTMRVAD